MMRIGIGYDIHRLVEGRALVLGGVRIPHNKGFLAHSDGDVLCHALMDALLGAAGLPNIGVLFPDADPAYKDRNSMELLEEVVIQVNRAGYIPTQIDSNIIAENPKLQPYLQEMRQNMAQCLSLDANCVSIKPRTNEQVGQEGNEEAISAQVVVLLQKQE